MRLTDHATLNFNRDMSTAAVFLDTENPCDTTWHLGLLHKLYKFEFSASIMRLISLFLSYRKFKFSVEDEISSPREVEIGVPRYSVLSPTFYSKYISDAPQIPSLLMTHLCGRSQRRICSRKSTARYLFGRDVALALERKKQ
jgi:hypothetical protein